MLHDVCEEKSDIDLEAYAIPDGFGDGLDAHHGSWDGCSWGVPRLALMDLIQASQIPRVSLFVTHGVVFLPHEQLWLDLLMKVGGRGPRHLSQKPSAEVSKSLKAFRGRVEAVLIATGGHIE